MIISEIKDDGDETKWNEASMCWVWTLKCGDSIWDFGKADDGNCKGRNISEWVMSEGRNKKGVWLVDNKDAHRSLDLPTTSYLIPLFPEKVCL